MQTLKFTIENLLEERSGIMSSTEFFKYPSAEIPQTNEFALKYKDYMLDCCKNANMFFVPALDVKEAENFNDKTCPPFTNCWFDFMPEIEDTESEIHQHLREQLGLADYCYVKTFVKGVGLFEVSPTSYLTVFVTKEYIYDRKDDKKIGMTDRMNLFAYSLGENKGNIPAFYDNIIKATLSRIRRTKITYVENDIGFTVRGRIGREFTKIKYKPSDVIYVATAAKIKKLCPTAAERIVKKPAYAYEVMGHWRKLDDNSVGKDRQGLRGVAGYTWVIPHKRGEGELFKKSRIIKRGKNES